jgi:hypothetical protein
VLNKRLLSGRLRILTIVAGRHYQVARKDCFQIELAHPRATEKLAAGLGWVGIELRPE